MSTIVDVANAAGVSISTASRALRGLDRVSPQTRERVRRAADQLGYVAAPTGTALASGKTGVIALVAYRVTYWYFASAVTAIQRRLREGGYRTMLFDLDETSFGGRRELDQGMLVKRVDGVISLCVPLSDEERDLLDRFDLPLTSMGTVLNGRPCVCIDDAQAMRMATRHLLDLGHRDIAYVGELEPGFVFTETPHARQEAFRDVIEAAGLDPRTDGIALPDWTSASGARAGHALLTSQRRPTAIAAAADDLAFGVLAAAGRLGLRVPEDVAVVGIDDHALAPVFDLTTVRQNVDRLGAEAADVLLRRLRDPAGPTPTDIRLPAELVVRGSTGPAHP